MQPEPPEGLEVLSKSGPAADRVPPYVIYLGLNCADPAVRRRVDQLRRAGVLIAACTFSRNPNTGRDSKNPDYDLGYIRDGSFLTRIPGLCIGFARLIGLRGAFRSASVLIARNLDNLLLAVMLKKFGFYRGAIVYEVLDIHFRLFGNAISARIMRRVEAHLLQFVELIVVSSEDFEKEYFRRYFREVPPIILVENRLYLDAFFDSHPQEQQKWQSLDRTKTTFDPASLAIGWVGAFRCRRSAEILREVARTNPRYTLHLAGRPTYCSEDEFRSFFQGLGNVKLWGGYAYPDDLYRIYRMIDLNWCVDLKDTDKGMEGTNAAWLLANRLYEGGYFGVPQIGLAGTAMGRYICEKGIGWTLTGEPVAALNQLLASLDREAYQAVKQKCIALMGGHFQYANDIASVLDSVAGVVGLRAVKN